MKFRTPVEFNVGTETYLIDEIVISLDHDGDLMAHTVSSDGTENTWGAAWNIGALQWLIKQKIESGEIIPDDSPTAAEERKARYTDKALF